MSPAFPGVEDGTPAPDEIIGAPAPDTFVASVTSAPSSTFNAACWAPTVAAVSNARPGIVEFDISIAW